MSLVCIMSVCRVWCNAPFKSNRLLSHLNPEVSVDHTFSVVNAYLEKDKHHYNSIP